MSRARTRRGPAATCPPETIRPAMDVVEIAEPHYSLRSRERSDTPLRLSLREQVGCARRPSRSQRTGDCGAVESLPLPATAWRAAYPATRHSLRAVCARSSSALASHKHCPFPVSTVPISRGDRFINQLVFAHPGYTRRIGAKPMQCEQFASREPARGCGARAMVQERYLKPEVETSTEEGEGRLVAHRARKKCYVPSPPRLHIGGNTSELSPQLKACSFCQRCARGNGRTRGRRGECLAVGWEACACSVRAPAHTHRSFEGGKVSPCASGVEAAIPAVISFPSCGLITTRCVRHRAHVCPAWRTHAGACVPVWRPHATTLARVVLKGQCRTGKQERVERAQSKRKTKKQLIAAHPTPRAVHRNDFL